MKRISLAEALDALQKKGAATSLACKRQRVVKHRATTLPTVGGIENVGRSADQLPSPTPANPQTIEDDTVAMETVPRIVSTPPTIHEMGDSSHAASEAATLFCPEPYVLSARRRINTADSCLEDRAVAFGLANNMILPRDRDALQQQSTSDLRLDGFHHLMAGMQHFIELGVRQAVELRAEKKDCREANDKASKLKKEVDNLKKSLKSKEKEAANAAEASKKELEYAHQKIKEHEEALKKANEQKAALNQARVELDEAKKQMASLKEQHKSDLEKAYNEGYTEATMAVAEEVDGMKNKIYQAGYELGLQSANVPLCDDLYEKVVKCPEDLLIVAEVLEVDAELTSAADVAQGDTLQA